MTNDANNYKNRQKTTISWFTTREKERKEKIGISVFIMVKEACVIQSFSFKDKQKQKAFTKNEKKLSN